MKRQSLWRISVVTTPEAEDVVSELIATVFGRRASSYFNLETGVSMITIYCEQKPASFPTARKIILAGLRRVNNCGLAIGSGKITLAKVRREDWAESWKRHFKPIEIIFKNRRGELREPLISSEISLLVKPSWSKKAPRKNQAVVVLDPGLSFGTGQHPTTAFCLRALVRHRITRTARSFLDMGAGSGILAIAAVKLGFSPVSAFDFDPEAVRVARANASANGVQNKLRMARADVTKLPAHPARRYDLICANLISTLLISERRRIVAQLDRGGTLVLAGILKSEFAQVQKVFEALGLKLTDRKVENEWCSGSFVTRGEIFEKY